MQGSDAYFTPKEGNKPTEKEICPTKANLTFFY